MTLETNMARHAEDAEGRLMEAGSRQYLTFKLAGEEFGLDILRVQEIRPWAPVTRMPAAPSHVEGVLNLRGVVVPIIDLRTRLALPRAEYGSTTVIIVLHIEHEGIRRMAGLVVDAVSDVTKVRPADHKPVPDFGVMSDVRFVRAMVALEERMVMLLDVDHLVDPEDLAELAEMSEPKVNTAATG
jgi:purine-binding chemotaxis protein CheW